MTDTRDATYDRYKTDITTGAVLRKFAASDRSIMGYQTPTTPKEAARTLHTLTTLAVQLPTQAFVDAVSRIVRKTGGLGLTPGDFRAKIADAAAEVLEEGWFDTWKAASPNPGRMRDLEHRYTEREAVILTAWVTHAIRDGGPGWCLARMMDEHKLQPWERPE